MGVIAASIPASTSAPAPASGSETSGRERTLITPEGIALPITVASRASRFGAIVIDFMILIIAMTVIDIALSFITNGAWSDALTDGDTENRAAVEALVILRILLNFFIWYGYFLAQELGPRGATLGKRAVGIRVASRDGGRLTPEAVVARNLLRDIEIFFPLIALIILTVLRLTGTNTGSFIWAAVIWFLLFAFFLFFNKDRLRAGDIIAGTWVVEAPKTKLADALSTQGAAAAGSSEVTGAKYQFGEEELAIYGEHELQTLERVLRTGQPDAIIAVHDAICRKIDWDPGAGDERAFLEAFYAQLRAKLENDMRFGRRKADKYS